jgi:hypothetical protein
MVEKPPPSPQKIVLKNYKTSKNLKNKTKKTPSFEKLDVKYNEVYARISNWPD